MHAGVVNIAQRLISIVNVFLHSRRSKISCLNCHIVRDNRECEIGQIYKIKRHYTSKTATTASSSKITRVSC